MKEEAVNDALSKAVAFDTPSLDKCSLSLAVITFLDKLGESANWWQKLGISAATGAVHKWRRTNCQG